MESFGVFPLACLAVPSHADLHFYDHCHCLRRPRETVSGVGPKRAGPTSDRAVITSGELPHRSASSVTFSSRLENLPNLWHKISPTSPDSCYTRSKQMPGAAVLGLITFASLKMERPSIEMSVTPTTEKSSILDQSVKKNCLYVPPVPPVSPRKQVLSRGLTIRFNTDAMCITIHGWRYKIDMGSLRAIQYDSIQ